MTLKSDRSKLDITYTSSRFNTSQGFELLVRHFDHIWWRLPTGVLGHPLAAAAVPHLYGLEVEV